MEERYHCRVKHYRAISVAGPSGAAGPTSTKPGLADDLMSGDGSVDVSSKAMPEDLVDTIICGILLVTDFDGSRRMIILRLITEEAVIRDRR